MTLSAGSKLGPYELLASLGAGGMGEVYRARDTRLSRWSPDGKKIYYTLSRKTGDIFLLEGF